MVAHKSASNAAASVSSSSKAVSASVNDKIDPNLKLVDTENADSESTTAATTTTSTDATSAATDSASAIDPEISSKKDIDGDEIMNEEIANSEETREKHGKKSDEDDEEDDDFPPLTEEQKERKQIFYSNLKNLTDSLSDTLNEISIVISKIYDQNTIFSTYSEELLSSDKFQTLNSYMDKVKDVVIAPAVDSEDPTAITNLSLHEKARASKLYRDEKKAIDLGKYPPLTYNDGGMPDIDLNNQAKTVKDVWDEWTIGHKNKPALQELERKFGTRWRRGRIAKSAQRRKKVIEFIEAEYKRHSAVIPNILSIVQQLDNYRTLKGKGLFWLYGALPDRLYDDAGQPLFKGDGQSIVEAIVSAAAASSSVNGSKEDESSEKSESEKKDDEEKKDSEDQEDNSKSTEKTDDDKIDEALKAVDGSKSKDDESTKESSDDKKSDEMDIDAPQQEKSKSIPNEEEEEIEDLDEDMDDEDVLPSVADVAAMASMSVEGEDDEHALVNSAALAVAAQHVADQQRLRDRQKSSRKSQNDNEEGDLNNYISTEDGLNENTDPALSKL